MPRRGERVAPALAAILLALSYPPLHPLVLPFVGLVPLAVWLSCLPEGRAGAASARRGAALFGVLYFGLMLHWVLVALFWLTPVGILVFVVGLALLGGLTAAFGHAFHYAVRGLGAPVWLALPTLWTGLEWTRAHLPGTLALPWLGLGTALTGFPELVGIAEIVGARGVTFWIASVNGLLACALLARPGTRGMGAQQQRRAATYLVAALSITAAPMAWGVWRAAHLETWSAGRVAILQPNVAQRVRVDTAVVRDSTFGALDRLVRLVEPASARVAVLPEMVLPIEPENPRYSSELERLQGYARELGVPLLLGARGRSSAAGSGHPRNSVFLLDPQGLEEYRYDKRRLVPVVERTLLLPVLSSRFRPAGDFAPGDAWPVAYVDGVAFGAFVCFESSFEDVGRALRNAGADVLVNVTNDAWFGREPAHARTVALWQHPAHLIMRAIESRAGVVRAANSGLSWVVSPTGRVVGSIGLFEEGALVVDVETTDVETLYARFGDVLGNVSAVILALTLLGAWRGVGRRAGEGP